MSLTMAEALTAVSSVLPQPPQKVTRAYTIKETRDAIAKNFRRDGYRVAMWYKAGKYHLSAVKHG